MITGIAIDGMPVLAHDILAEITVLHGRKNATDGATASSATVVVISPVIPVWAEGSQLVLTGDSGPVFTGRITDRELTHDHETNTALFTMTAMGTVAKLGYRNVGDEPWPEESGTARAERILTLAEVPYLIDGMADALVLPRDVDSSPALSLLQGLCNATGAAVVDLPDGRVVYQPMRERARPVRPMRWQDFDTAETWDTFTPEFMWLDFVNRFSADSEFPLDIPTNAIEWEPKWQSSESGITNHVRVGYGVAPEGGAGGQPWTEVKDDASVAKFEKRYQYFGTELANAADAIDYASWKLAVLSRPHWQFKDSTVHLGDLDDIVRLEVLRLTCGDHIRIDGFPTPTPAIIAEAIVEGWTYSMWGENGNLFETIVLHSSSLLESLAVATWLDYSPTFEWQQYDPALMWADIVAIG